MGWQIVVDQIDSKNKVIKSLIGSVNYCSNDHEFIDVSIRIDPNKEMETIRFKQSNGKSVENKNFRLALKEVNYLNDPKNWNQVKPKLKK